MAGVLFSFRKLLQSSLHQYITTVMKVKLSNFAVSITHGCLRALPFLNQTALWIASCQGIGQTRYLALTLRGTRESHRLQNCSPDGKFWPTKWSSTWNILSKISGKFAIFSNCFHLLLFYTVTAFTPKIRLPTSGESKQTFSAKTCAKQMRHAHTSHRNWSYLSSL